MGSVEMEEFERDNFVPLKRPQILAALAMTLGAYGIGTVCAWTAPAIPDIEATKHFGEITENEKSLCASIVPLAALTAGPAAGFLVDYYGRRITALFIALPFLIGWTTIAFAPTMFILICGRFITGLCIGALSLTIPMFIAEITEEKIRGSVSSLFPFMAGFGILNTYILGSFMTWFQLTLANMLVPVFFFISMYFVPESPIYLLSKGRTEKARRALKWFRGAEFADEIERELQQFRRGIDEKKDRKLSAKEFFSPSVIKPNIICVTLMFFQQFSGINAVIFYTVEIFASAKTDIDPNVSSIIVGIVLLFSVTVSTVLIDRLGRRILLIISDGGMAIALFGLGLFFYLKEQNENEAPEGLTWLPLVSLMLFVLSFNIGFGPVPWLALGELLPSHVKGFGAGVATAFSWFLAFLVTKCFNDFIYYLGVYGCYWMFGIICSVGTVYCSLFVPETKGKTLDEIQLGFQ